MADATVEINPRFNTLNSNNLRTKQDFGSRERRAIVDVILVATQPQTGLFDVDFSTIRNFTEVYACRTIQASPELLGITTFSLFSYIPTAKSAAGQFFVVGPSFVAHNEALTGTITVEIIGI